MDKLRKLKCKNYKSSGIVNNKLTKRKSNQPSKKTKSKVQLTQCEERGQLLGAGEGRVLAIH